MLLISTLVVCTISLLYLFGILTKFDNMAYDALIRLVRLKKRGSSEIALVLIDEPSLEVLNPIVGRWPWPRAIYSDLLDFLSMGKPRAVLFDILFTENQKDGSGSGLGADDRQLVSATRETGLIYHAMQVRVDDPDDFNGNLLNRPLPGDFVRRFSMRSINTDPGYMNRNNNFYLPFPELYQASHGMGVVEFSPDPDGIFRRTMPVREYGDVFFPVLGLAPFVDEREVEMDGSWIRVGSAYIPVDANGECILNYYGSFDAYSVSGILASLQRIRRGDVEDLITHPMEFRDKIVFIGASAAGVEDLKHTPLSPRTPGVFLHATLASNVLMNDFLIPPTTGMTLSAIFMMTLLCVAGIILFERYLVKLLFPLGTSVIWISFIMYQLRSNILHEVVPPLAAILAGGMVSLGYLLVTEGREKFRVKRLFSRYVSPDLLHQALEDDDLASPRIGTTVDITVVFADIRNFTSFANRNPPEKVVEMLNLFFSRMTDIILSHNGRIDKFIGDAIMAFWGASAGDVHPRQAVVAAIDMIHALEPLGNELRERGFDFDLNIGIGINSGSAILGTIGSQDKLNYTIVGDTVNVASRLQELTKTYECPIIISESTYRMLGTDIPCRLVDVIHVRGKEKRIRIYEPVCHCDPRKKNVRELCAITNEAFDLYQNRDFEGAMEMYYLIEDGRLKDIFITRCKKRLRRNDH
ncbi:MAG: CHASE2 domain-containing protein [bacterium]